MTGVRTIDAVAARRLAVAGQRLAGQRPPPTENGLLDLFRDLGCVQLDPTSAVAPNHLLVPWSRLGRYDVADLDSLRWQRRALFDYWAHAASIVLTEDFPIHHLRMRQHPRHDYASTRKIRAFVATNDQLRRHILAQLRRRGPLLTSEIEDRSAVGWVSTGWTHGRNVDRMLAFLWMQGRVLVAGRRGQQRAWDLASRVLPPWTPKRRLTEPTVVRMAAERSLGALGIGTARHIEGHFTVGAYPGLDAALRRLQREGRIEEVRVVDRGAAWPGRWYVRTSDLPAQDEAQAGWEPRTTLLSPFDNLIRDRARTEFLFGFRFRLEIYVPKDKREFGFFVMPILHGDRLVGRVDPLMDRSRGVLKVNAVHLEPGVRTTKGLGRSVARALRALGAFLGAGSVEPPAKLPDGWRQAF